MANDPGVRLQRGGSGYFQVMMTPPDGVSVDVSMFRDVPTKVASFSTADPFGDSSASLSFDSITPYDIPGYGDLKWLVPWTQVTIFWWDLIDGVAVRKPDWVWEGFIISEEISMPYQLQCLGTLFLYDNHLAIPFYPSNPVPYEVLMARMFSDVPTRWNKKLKIEWPEKWNTVVPARKDPSYLWFLKPWGVKVGQKWSGLTTRNTGGWENMLTGFIQGLLTTMYTPEGDQWTIMKGYGREPILRVRQPLTMANDKTMVVFYGVPGVEASLSRDWSQSANVIYGAGQDLAGTSFSGAQVSPDGESTWYEPFAALPQVYPTAATNPRRITTMIRKESRLQFAQGVDETAAREAAVAQIRRFGDPGYTGTITLRTDPLVAGLPSNRFLITAGSQIQLRNFRGADILFHIATATVNPEDGSVSLTVDTKFRDALTISEVRARTRDALDPVNLLKAGQVSAAINDSLKPWSYSEGSGIIPSAGKDFDATPFFKSMPAGIAFPWTDWTTKYPPKKFPQYYVKVSNKKLSSPIANDRWQDYGYTSKSKYSIGIPIKGAQEATIRLTQIAAFDKDGNVIKIRFHVGFYANSGIRSSDMPVIPTGQKGLPAAYKAGQYYPFFPGAFNQWKRSGEQNDPNIEIAAGMVMYAAWGTYEEPAGYSPGTKGVNGAAAKTGKLVDEGNWQMSAAANEGDSFSWTSAADNAKNKTAGMWYAMIFQDDVDVAYFLGRCYRLEPGMAN